MTKADHILMLKVVRKSGALLMTWVNTIIDKSQSYPDIKSCKEVRSLVDDVGELVATQLLVVVDVALLQHLHNLSAKVAKFG